MYRHILVPIDLSHGEVGAHIAGVAKTLVDEGGKITLLKVLESIPGYVANYIPQGTIDRSRQEAREGLEALARQGGLAPRIVLRSGHAATEILEEAREAGCDAIILGSHRPNFGDYFIGSTAARVVRHAQCTVIVERSGPVTTT